MTSHESCSESCGDVAGAFLWGGVGRRSEIACISAEGTTGEVRGERKADLATLTTTDSRCWWLSWDWRLTLVKSAGGERSLRLESGHRFRCRGWLGRFAADSQLA